MHVPLAYDVVMVLWSDPDATSDLQHCGQSHEKSLFAVGQAVGLTPSAYGAPPRACTPSMLNICNANFCS